MAPSEPKKEKKERTLTGLHVRKNLRRMASGGSSRKDEEAANEDLLRADRAEAAAAAADAWLCEARLAHGREVAARAAADAITGTRSTARRRRPSPPPLRWSSARKGARLADEKRVLIAEVKRLRAAADAAATDAAAARADRQRLRTAARAGEGTPGDWTADGGLLAEASTAASAAAAARGVLVRGPEDAVRPRDARSSVLVVGVTIWRRRRPLDVKRQDVLMSARVPRAGVQVLELRARAPPRSTADDDAIPSTQTQSSPAPWWPSARGLGPGRCRLSAAVGQRAEVPLRPRRREDHRVAQSTLRGRSVVTSTAPSASRSVATVLASSGSVAGARRARVLPLFSFFVAGGFQVHASAASSPPVLLWSRVLPCSVIGRLAWQRSALKALALMRASIIWRQCS